MYRAPTFDAETRGLEPDYKLPDLILPGRPATGAPSQAEFVQVPADYVKEASSRGAGLEGQRLMQKYRAALSEIETRFGVPATTVLAIWGRETDYGRYGLPHDTLRVVATQAYVGRRKDQYRTEFILALKILGEGAVTRKDMRVVLGRRHRPHPVPAVGVLQARASISTATAAHRHLELGAGCARLGRATAEEQGLAARRALGL